MQDRYAGDVGDFGKFGLLRWLCGVEPRAEPFLDLGIVWYLVPDESHNDDGKHVSYLLGENLLNARFRSCDPDLYERLATLITRGERRVSAIHELNLFPSSTRYFAEQLSFRDMVPGERRIYRHTWVQDAMAATQGCELVFVDPDNGLQVGSTGPFRARGPKYAFFDELLPFLQRGQSLVVYQHVDRRASAEVQARRRIAEIRERLNVNRVWAVQFCRGSRRLFCIMPAGAHEEILHERTSQLLGSSWCEQKHFQPVLELP